MVGADLGPVMASTEETKPPIDQHDGVNAIAKRKMKKMVRLALEDVDWAALAAGGPGAQAFLSDSCRREDLVRFLTGGPRCAYGLLCTSPLRLRLVILKFLENSGMELVADTPGSGIRALYEAVRDAAWRHLSLPEPLSPTVGRATDVERLRRATLRALGCLLVGLDCRFRDPRLFRMHVQFLLNLLYSPTSSTSEMLLAAEALDHLEGAYPGLLIDTAWKLVEEVESIPLSGGPLDALQNAKVLLAVNVLANAAELYKCNQQTDQSPGSPTGGLAASQTSSNNSPRSEMDGIVANEHNRSASPEPTDEAALSARHSMRSVLHGGEFVSVTTSEGSFSSSHSGGLHRASEPSGDLIVIRLLERKGPSQLRRFRLSPALGRKDSVTTLLLSAAARHELAQTTLCLLRLLPRAVDGSAQRIAARLPSLLRLLCDEDTSCDWKPGFADGVAGAMHMLLGNTELLPVVLDLQDAAKDALSGLCEPHGSFETEVLRVVASATRSDEDRILAVRWLHARFVDASKEEEEGGGGNEDDLGSMDDDANITSKGHSPEASAEISITAADRVSSIHNKAGAVLAMQESWALLLPFEHDPAAVFAARIRALAAVLEAGLGNAWHAVCAVLAWQGYDRATSDGSGRAGRYALRVLCGVAASRRDLALALHVGAIHSVVTRPASFELLAEILQNDDETNGVPFSLTGTVSAVFEAALDSVLSSPDGEASGLSNNSSTSTKQPGFACLAAPTVPRDWGERGALILADAGKLFSLARRGMRNLKSSLSQLGKGENEEKAKMGLESQTREESEGTLDDSCSPSKLTPTMRSPMPVQSGPFTPTSFSNETTSSASFSARLRSSVSSATSALLTTGRLPASIVTQSSFSVDERLRDQRYCESKFAQLCAGAAIPRVWSGHDDGTAADHEQKTETEWLESPATWRATAAVAVANDPLAQRRLILAAGVPASALRWLAAYFSAYRGQTRAQTLKTREAGAAALALCHAALLRCDRDDDARYAALETLLSTLAAKFPDARVRDRASSLLSLLREQPGDLGDGIAHWYIAAALADN